MAHRRKPTPENFIHRMYEQTAADFINRRPLDSALRTEDYPADTEDLLGRRVTIPFPINPTTRSWA
jgi:hypothetical protein